jgi:hypothetical protein
MVMLAAAGCTSCITVHACLHMWPGMVGLCSMVRCCWWRVQTKAHACLRLSSEWYCQACPRRCAHTSCAAAGRPACLLHVCSTAVVPTGRATAGSQRPGKTACSVWFACTHGPHGNRGDQGDHGSPRAQLALGEGQLGRGITVEESVTSRFSTVVRSQVPRGTEIHRGCVRGHVASQRASIDCVNRNRGQTTESPRSRKRLHGNWP